MPERITYLLSVNGKKGRYPDLATIDGACYAAYLAARDDGESVTIVQVEGDEDLEFTPLCVITSLPVRS